MALYLITFYSIFDNPDLVFFNISLYFRAYFGFKLTILWFNSILKNIKYKADYLLLFFVFINSAVVMEFTSTYIYIKYHTLILVNK